MPIRLDDTTRRSLDHLLGMAKGNTPQAERAGRFLLAWYDADGCGGFDLTDLWEMDNATLRACTVVFLWVASHRATPADVGFTADLNAVLNRHGFSPSAG